VIRQDSSEEPSSSQPALVVWTLVVWTVYSITRTVIVGLAGGVQHGQVGAIGPAPGSG
jgi:hypothetical protein